MKKLLLLLFLIPNLVMADDKPPSVAGAVSASYSSTTEENFGVKVFEIFYYNRLKNIDGYCNLSVTSLTNINCNSRPSYRNMFLFSDHYDSSDAGKCTATKIEKDVWKLSYKEGNPDIPNSFIKQYDFVFNEGKLTSFNGFEKIYNQQTKKEEVTNYTPISADNKPYVDYPLQCDSIRLPAIEN